AHRFESFGLKCGSDVDARAALRAREERAETAARGGADHNRAAAEAQDAERLAQRHDAILRPHRTDEASGVIDHGEIERPALGAEAGQRRDLDVDATARLPGAVPRT